MCPCRRWTKRLYQEIELALLDKRVDLAVHSMKAIAFGAATGALPEAVVARENPGMFCFHRMAVVLPS